MPSADPRWAELEAHLTEAHLQAQRRAWEPAALAYQRGAELAMDLQAAGPARRAWDAAGEAFRRADRPKRAVAALSASLSLPQPDDDEETAVTARIRLAGCLSELGTPHAAREEAAQALAEAVGGLRALALDTLIGSVLGVGATDELRPWVAELAEIEPLGGGFRAAQLARLDADWEAAEAALAAVDALVPSHASDAARAAVDAERAENQLLRGHPADAVEAFARARVAHARAGRAALAWRSEAGRVRAAVEAGVALLDPGLDDPVREVMSRGMVPLEIDLRIARAMALAAVDPPRADQDLERAGALADRIGDRFRGGRSRLERARRTEFRPDLQRALLARAAELLVDHRALLARCY